MSSSLVPSTAGIPALAPNFPTFMSDFPQVEHIMGNFMHLDLDFTVPNFEVELDDGGISSGMNQLELDPCRG